MPSYSKNAENLAHMGLLKSGYRDYLKGISESIKKGRADELKETLNIQNSLAKKGYYKYLENYDKNQNAIKNNVERYLLSQNILNKDTAYSYAAEQGLASKNAKDVSDYIYNVNYKKLLKYLTKQVAYSKLDSKSAVKVAEDMGLSHDESVKVGEYVKKYEKLFNKESNDYYDYLESLGNKNTHSYPIKSK